MRIRGQQYQGTPFGAFIEQDVPVPQPGGQALHVDQKWLSCVEINGVAGWISPHAVIAQTGQNRLQTRSGRSDLYGRIEERQIKHTQLWNRRDRRRRGTPSFWSAPP